MSKIIRPVQLARDGIGAVFELNRADAIASKPAPTWGCAVSSLNLCFCCSQGNVQTTRMPLFHLGVCGGYVLGVAVIHPEYISIRCATAFYGFRPYGGSLLSNSHKSKQKGLAPAYGPRFAQVSLVPVPLRGHAVTGHPWPSTALPASMPGGPLRRTSTRPPEGAGRSKAMPAEAADRPACYGDGMCSCPGSILPLPLL